MIHFSTKLILIIPLLISCVYSSESTMEKIRLKEEFYTTPSIGCCHRWNKWRPHHFEAVEQINQFDSLSSNLRSNVNMYLDSVVGADWEQLLHFDRLDVSQMNSGNPTETLMLYSLWFTYEIADTAYYCSISTDSTAREIFFRSEYVVSNNPKRISSLTNIWNKAIETGLIPERIRPTEVFLRLNREIDEFYWEVWYYRGISYLFGPVYCAKISAETGNMIDLEKRR